MKPILKLLWLAVAIVLVAPTATLDLQTLFHDAGPPARAGRLLLSAAGGSSQSRQHTPPPPLEYTVCPGDTIAFPFQIFLPPAPLQADILFAFDTTGSMKSVINETQERAVEIMADLQTLIEDVQFGLVDFRDYPFVRYGKATDWPYRLRQGLTHSTAGVQQSIEELEGDGGLDEPEAYARALYEAYADENIGWRSEARRFVVMFGDSVPHDDNLNAGVPTPQPYRPNSTWRTGYPPAHIDPGRDAEEGTADDLDFQQVLGALGDRSITLLFVVSDAKVEVLTTDDLLAYWQTWAAMTGSGGDAQALAELDDLPATILSLVTVAVRHIDRLTVVVAPSWFEEWVTVTPPAFEDVDIPSTGLTLDLQVTISVPPTMPADHYMFDLIVAGDGTVYHRQRVEITVSEGCFVTPTPTWAPPPTPRPRRLLFMPVIAHNFVSWQPQR